MRPCCDVDIVCIMLSGILTPADTIGVHAENCRNLGKSYFSRNLEKLLL